jgi:hypothetical protein
MPDMKDWTNVYLVIGFIVPGLITFFVRSQFVVVRRQTHTDNILSYVTLTSVYYAFLLPIFPHILSATGWELFFEWLGVIIVGPAVFGAGLGVAAYFEAFRAILRRCKINPIHAVPSSWDWLFGSIKRRSVFLMVTLTDGTKLSGVWGGRSFASTDPSERDIYIERMWDVSEEGTWTKRDRDQGTLIVAKEIRYVEFYDL